MSTRASVPAASGQPGPPDLPPDPVNPRPLEPAGAKLRALLDEVADYLVGVVDRLPAAPMTDVDGVAELLADPSLRQPPPALGRPLTELLAVIDRAAAKGYNTSSAGHLAYIPGGGLVTAAVADLIALVLNRYTGLAFPAPGLVAMEADVLRWVADLFDLPAEAAGLLTTGASMATLSAVITARTARLGERFLDGTVYVTGQTHAACAKACRLAGFPEAAVRVVPVDADLRMDPAALSSAIAVDRAAGRRPCCVVASAGTTNTGTVDPLPAIADIAAQEGLWLHVDAAYGGFFQLTERGRRRLSGIERADSIVLDGHKGLFLPYGSGCLLVRDGSSLRAAHAGPEAHFLQDIQDSTLPDFAAYGPELTRDFRGLKLWLPLHLHGVDAFRAALDEKLDLAEHAYRRLVADPNLVVLGAPELSTVAFRCRPHPGAVAANGDSAAPDAAADEATAEVLRRVNAERRVLLSSTRIDGRFVGRVSVLSHRTDLARVDEAVDAILRHAAALRAADR
jgi:aromatic-L-amino-acid/L-tryptophan decarboxylase